MAKPRRPIDKVRASRDGHEYHEAWTARKATQLLLPGSDLTAIAVEGLSPADQAGASAQTVDIADLTLYFRGESFEDASRTTFAQFKYSIANRDTDFRAADAKKTVEKFAKTYRDFKRKYGARAVQDKLDFQIVTNQPISGSFLQAIEALARNAPRTGDVETQAKQFETACGLTGRPLAAFAQKVHLIGRTGSLPETKSDLACLLVDWSATHDPIASARLGNLRNLVRDKAGYAGTGRNLITRTDILAALEISDPRDLLPCEAALPDVGKILEREQLPDAITRISQTTRPLLIHAAGGIGKTVFMDTLAGKVASDHEVVFFDCFGGGAYRSPEDARHLPKHGLIHIANTLAFRGLCDPMLPDSTDLPSLLRTFRRRLSQSIATLSRVMPGRTLVLFLDAIDNAEIAALARSEDCFPIKVLESLESEPIAGLKLIVSCRTERKLKTYARYDAFTLRPFSKDETATFLAARIENVSPLEINVAQARSGGNPRVLEYLLKAGRGLLEESEIEKTLDLDDLIQDRITDALSTAIERGYQQQDIQAFLAGLAVLPPPVPLEEYAGAHGIEISATESFAADLYPLLERTNQGLMFRDEPTETLVRKQYASSHAALQRLAANLQARQDVSVYAARALPGLLHQLDDGEQLLALAFDSRIPSSITSTVGKRHVRYARLKAATLHSALKKNYNNLVSLMLELSTMAAVDHRGVEYILNNPDLVIAAKDADATRRLFEVRTRWPGTRHARLAIANTLSAELEEGYRHAYALNEWIRHYRRSPRDDNGLRDPGPDHTDIAALSFFLISDGRGNNAARFLEDWRDWFVYEVCELIFTYSDLAHTIRFFPSTHLAGFVDSLSGIGSLSAILCFQELSVQRRTELAIKLANCCKTQTKLEFSNSFHRGRSNVIQDGLRKAAVIALSLGFTKEAMVISLRAPHERPGLWSFRETYYRHDVFAFLFRAALLAAAKSEVIHERDVLPKELAPICSRIPRTVTGDEFLKRARTKISKHFEAKKKEPAQDKHALQSHREESQSAEWFLNNRLGSLLALTRALSAFTSADSAGVDNAFLEIVSIWKESAKSRDPYQNSRIDHFFLMLGREIAIFSLWARPELKPASVGMFLAQIHDSAVGAHDLVRIVEILAKEPKFHALAGEQAIKARELIETEDDVNSRASLYSALARALLPANLDEASAYFRNGLEQMDAIGSGDYEFTNELLLFASQLKGEELGEREFHTLSNICELNMGEEPEKFFWGAYGRGLAKAAGLRGLAKLSRWDDRSKISLNNTLLPYLTGLVESGKIGAREALALNRLANPVEYYFAGTKEFAEALYRQAGRDPVVVAELINQFHDDNPDPGAGDTVGTLFSLADEALGSSSEVSQFLASARARYEAVRDTYNERSNFHSQSDHRMLPDREDRNRSNQEALDRIVASTNPTDPASLVQAIDQFNALGNMYDLKGGFFEALRAKVPYGERGRYVQNIAELENLFYYWKFAELHDAKRAWGSSSISLGNVFKGLAAPLINAHADDLVHDGRLSGSNLKEISDLTGVLIADLVLELIRAFARPDSSVSGSVWLSLATFVCPEAEEGVGQQALNRLLYSDASRLADNVIDGSWVEGLYPQSDFPRIASGLVWRVLGSPYAIDRWRGGHCLRSFARFGRWDVVDSLVRRMDHVDAGPFQARELSFYYLHARLWLLISLARIALDHPIEVARYKDILLSFALEEGDPHVLMRHFAAHALVSCIDAGSLALPAEQVGVLRIADLSPHPRLRKKIRNNGGFYDGRPESEPKPPYKFHLDYDFHKFDVDNLSQVFGQPCWKVAGLMAEIVHGIDPSVDSMYSLAGREAPYRRDFRGITTAYHTHGQQLGFHALFLAAGKLLKSYPVTDDWWYEADPWREWLDRYVLTRSDGLWLSDGTDRMPLEIKEFLLERQGKDLTIIGDRERILCLAGIDSCVGEELVVYGRWSSADGVRVHISSALVPPGRAATLARELAREEPFSVWIPCFSESEDNSEFLRSEKREYAPWIVSPSGDCRLDEHDPYGSSVANLRPRLARNYATIFPLSKHDPFGRIWTDNSGHVALRSEAWGGQDNDSEDGPRSGTRLFCTSSVLREILTKFDKDLLILVDLQRYEKESYRSDSKYSNTVAILRVAKDLQFEYVEGRINHPHKLRF